jgi:hypothetical protein
LQNDYKTLLSNEFCGSSQESSAPFSRRGRTGISLRENSVFLLTGQPYQYKKRSTVGRSRQERCTKKFNLKFEAAMVVCTKKVPNTRGFFVFRGGKREKNLYFRIGMDSCDFVGNDCIGPLRHGDSFGFDGHAGGQPQRYPASFVFPSL